MTSSYRRLVLHPVVVLLMLVAMVFATAVDAAECGAELAPGNSATLIAVDAAPTVSAAADEDRDDSGAPAEQHGVCGHGHCHHGASFAQSVQRNAILHAPVVLVAMPSAALTSDLSNQLRRPPRV